MKSLAIIGFLLAACGHGNGGEVIIDAGETQCGELTCSPSELCDFGLNTCGSSPDETRSCKPRLGSCPGESDVCGCDGNVHRTACDAYAAGADLDAIGNCPLRADQFSCGFKQCSLTGQVCQRLGDVFGDAIMNSSFDCVPLPSACSASPSCECLRANPVGLSISICYGDTSTGFHVVFDPAVR